MCRICSSRGREGIPHYLQRKSTPLSFIIMSVPPTHCFHDETLPATTLFDLADVMFYEPFEDFRSLTALSPSLRGRGGLDSEVR